MADSKTLRQDAKQAAICDTVGANSKVSDSCNQRVANNVNNGIPKTRGASGNPQTTGTLTVRKVCVTIGGAGTCNPSFNVQVSGNNPSPSSFSLTDGGSQSVTLGSGQFNVAETSTSGFTTSFSGDCNSAIAPGQQLTCTITNTAVPTTGTLTVNKVCVDPSGTNTCQDTVSGQFHLTITGNNPNPSGFELRGGGSQDITLGPGSFTITEDRKAEFRFTSFSGNCMQSSSNSLDATGTIAAGQHLTCTITNSHL